MQNESYAKGDKQQHQHQGGNARKYKEEEVTLGKDALRNSSSSAAAVPDVVPV